jgi:hypothetical protein
VCAEGFAGSLTLHDVISASFLHGHFHALL